MTNPLCNRHGVNWISWRCASLLWWACELPFLMAEVRGLASSCPGSCLLCFVSTALSAALPHHINARLHRFKIPCPWEQAALAALLSWRGWAAPRQGTLCMAGDDHLRSWEIPNPVVFTTGESSGQLLQNPPGFSRFCVCVAGAGGQRSRPATTSARLVPLRGPCPQWPPCLQAPQGPKNLFLAKILICE